MNVWRLMNKRIGLVALLAGLGLAPVVAQEAASQAASGSVVMPEVRCWNYQAVLRGIGYPRSAIRKQLFEGSATVEFIIDGNEVKDIKVLQATDPVFAEEAFRIASLLKCGTSDRPVKVQLPQLQWRAD